MTIKKNNSKYYYQNGYNDDSKKETTEHHHQQHQQQIEKAALCELFSLRFPNDVVFGIIFFLLRSCFNHSMAVIESFDTRAYAG